MIWLALRDRSRMPMVPMKAYLLECHCTYKCRTYLVMRGCLEWAEASATDVLHSSQRTRTCPGVPDSGSDAASASTAWRSSRGETPPSRTPSPRSAFVRHVPATSPPTRMAPGQTWDSLQGATPVECRAPGPRGRPPAAGSRRRRWEGAAWEPTGPGAERSAASSRVSTQASPIGVATGISDLPSASKADTPSWPGDPRPPREGTRWSLDRAHGDAGEPARRAGFARLDLGWRHSPDDRPVGAVPPQQHRPGEGGVPEPVGEVPQGAPCPGVGHPRPRRGGPAGGSARSSATRRVPPSPGIPRMPPCLERGLNGPRPAKSAINRRRPIMQIKDVLQPDFGRSKMVTDMLLADFTDAEIMVRPVAGESHGLAIWSPGDRRSTISAWPLCRAACRHCRPGLSNATRRRRRTDDAAAFLNKSEYLRLLDCAATALVAVLARCPKRVCHDAPAEMQSTHPRSATCCRWRRARNDALRSFFRRAPQAGQAGGFLRRWTFTLGTR